MEDFTPRPLQAISEKQLKATHTSSSDDMTSQKGLGFSTASSAKTRRKPYAANQIILEREAASLIKENKLKEASKALSHLIEQGSKKEFVFARYAAIERQLGNLEDAIALLTELTKIKPGSASNHLNLGTCLHENGDYPRACLEFKKAISLKGDFAGAHLNLGASLNASGDAENAIKAYKDALAINPNLAEAHNNIGNALRNLCRHQEAITHYQKSILIEPGDSNTFYNLGICLQETENYEDALSAYDNAIKLAPNSSDAYWNSAQLLLAFGNYELGLKYYEWRFKKDNKYRLPQIPPWNGDTKTKDTIFLMSEGGLGDTLHFMRYIAPLKESGVSTKICAPEKLHGLIKNSGLDSEPLGAEAAQTVKHGQWVSLMSLPQRLGVNPTNPIINGEYIQTTDRLRHKWEKIIHPNGRHLPVIGIHWQGNPNAEKTYLKNRSIPLEKFSKIAINNPNIKFLSLQKGPGSEQLTECSFLDRFAECQELVDSTWDFLESAAIISNCDLVITNDTACAHLAGGMGMETWLLLAKFPEWRWGLSGDSSFWYPSMRLFRQTTNGDWDSLMETVSTALNKKLFTSKL